MTSHVILVVADISSFTFRIGQELTRFLVENKGQNLKHFYFGRTMAKASEHLTH